MASIRRMPRGSWQATAIDTLRTLPRHIVNQRVFWTWARTDSFENAWRRAVAHAGIHNLRFHDLRHEAVSRLFERGLNPMEVAAISGHKTLQMLKRYSRPPAAAPALDKSDRPTAAPCCVFVGRSA